MERRSAQAAQRPWISLPFFTARTSVESANTLPASTVRRLFLQFQHSIQPAV